MLVSIALGQLLQRCAPNVGTHTMSAVVAYESGGRANAIGDNTARRSYFPRYRAAAQELAGRLLRRGHNIDVGYAQINSKNFPAYHLTPSSALEPCTNVSTGAQILRVAYTGAARTYGPGQVALVHALSAYNTGGYWAGLEYARGVYAAARALRYERPLGEPLPAPAAAPLARRVLRFRRTSQTAFARNRFTDAR